MPTLFRKTAKGQAEIETRAHRLPPRQRQLLIIVDGKRDREALATLVPQQLDALLQELIAQGFVEAFGAATGGPPAPSQAPSQASPPFSGPIAPQGPAAAPAQAPGGPSAADFEKLRREAVRALTDAVGPAAETVAMRMEKARTLEELRALFGQAAQVMASMRGRAAAEAYAQRFPPA